jgi:hypothetical protein
MYLKKICISRSSQNFTQYQNKTNGNKSGEGKITRRLHTISGVIMGEVVAEVICSEAIKGFEKMRRGFLRQALLLRSKGTEHLA